MRVLLWLAVALLSFVANSQAAASLFGRDLLGLGGSETPSPTEHTTPVPTKATTTAAPPPVTSTTTQAPVTTTTVAPKPTTSAPAVVSSVVQTSSVPSSLALTTSLGIAPSTSIAFVSASLNATSSISSALPTNTTDTSSSDSTSSNSKPIIIGSACGFVAIIAAGFGYAFLSKTRRNNRKKRVFGADEDDGMDPSIPAPSPFQRHNESLAPAGAAWEADQKRPLGPPSPYQDYNYPSPALTQQNGVRRSPPIAHSDAYNYAQPPPAASPYYDEHHGYDQQVYYDQYPQQPMEMQHVPHTMQSPQMNQQYQYYGHNDPYNYRQ